MIPEGLNLNVSVNDTKVQAVNQRTVAALLFVSTLWDSYPLAIRDLVVGIFLLRHDAVPHGIERAYRPIRRLTPAPSACRHDKLERRSRSANREERLPCS